MKSDYLFTGIGVALLTLFNEDGSLDATGTADLAGTLVELGAQAVVVAGTTGEASALSAEERVELVTAVRKVVLPGSGVPLISGTGARTAEEAASFTVAARDAGSDAVLALSLPGAPDQRPYYEVVAKAADDLPVLAYHYPKVSAPGITIDDLSDLPVAGLKDSSGDPGRLLQLLDRWGRPVYIGSPNLITMASALGCAGMVLGLANAEPEKCAAAWKGDAAAQLQLAKAVHRAEGDFPRGLKRLAAERFGTSVVTRSR